MFPGLDLCYTDLAQHSHNGRLGSTKQMIKVVISPTCVRPSFRHCTESTRAMTLDRVQRRKYNTSAEREEISSSSSSSPIGLDNFSQERKDRRPKRIAYLYLHGHRNIKRYGPFELGECSRRAVSYAAAVVTAACCWWCFSSPACCPSQCYVAYSYVIPAVPTSVSSLE